MHVEFANGVSKELKGAKVLAIIQKVSQDHFDCCGLNVKLDYSELGACDFDLFIADAISGGKTIKGHVVKGDNCFRIPVCIHGGNIGECVFGYVTPSLFD